MPGFDAIDQSWSTTDPAAAAKAGVTVVSGYLSNDPSKNWTRAKIDAYHKAGIGCLLNWESQAGAPLAGAATGAADATEAVDQARKLGAPAGTVIYFSCDQDVTAAQIAGPVAAYYRAAGKLVRSAGYRLGCYGEADLVHYLSSRKITDAEWQTLAWSGGRLDPAADFYQTAINQTVAGASVDYDRVIHPDQLGAWWPENSPYNTGDAMTPDDRKYVQQVVQNNAQAVIKVLRQVVQNNAQAVIKALPAKADGTYTKADLEAALTQALDGATIHTEEN